MTPETDGAFPGARPRPPLDPAAAARRLAALRRLAWMLDGAARVPGTRFRFGLNSVIGLVPGGGDAVLAALSLAIVWQARALGVPNPVLARMLANVGIEFAGGLVPVVGDVFDMAFKANLRNLDLIERHLGLDAGASRPGGWRRR